jgi:DNA-binding NtrC family response regulator
MGSIRKICGRKKKLQPLRQISLDERSKTIQSHKILIADDEFLIRWSLAQALSQEGYDVICVENGSKAIEAIKLLHFDFVITDLVMPELDGWKVLETIKQTGSPSRVIVMTAHGKGDTGMMAKEDGAWAYVEKPYLIERIKEILKKAFDGQFGSNLNFSPS